MEPSYFGSSAKPLLGIYHPPEGARVRELGVLLCYSGPQEYMRCHWAFRKLAALLAREGFHAFRFDYYGTGDSGGESDEGTLAQWQDDVQQALQELKDVSGVRKVSVVAFRLGAVVAARAPLKVRDLVLWEPVVNGREYVRELVSIHHRRFAHSLTPPRLPRQGPLGELLGLPFSATLQAEVEAADLLTTPLACRAERVTVVSSEDRPEHKALAESLGKGTGAPRIESRRVEEDVVSAADDDGFLLSTRAQREIAALLGDRP